MKLVNLTLPPFAFIESGGHEEENLLEGRTIIMHIRSSSILEIFDEDSVMLNDDVVKLKFTYTNRYGIDERMVMALHYCATLDAISDRKLIIEEVMKPAARWYADYCGWEDKNIALERGF